MLKVADVLQIYNVGHYGHAAEEKKTKQHSDCELECDQVLSVCVHDKSINASLSMKLRCCILARATENTGLPRLQVWVVYTVYHAFSDDIGKRVWKLIETAVLSDGVTSCHEQQKEKYTHAVPLCEVKRYSDVSVSFACLLPEAQSHIS